jgi:hypothetical protein
MNRSVFDGVSECGKSFDEIGECFAIWRRSREAKVLAGIPLAKEWTLIV